jgi:nitrate/nitrite transport system ATP-binding protein
LDSGFLVLSTFNPEEFRMVSQFIGSIAVAGQAAWERVRPIVVKETVALPALGFAGLISLRWVIANIRLAIDEVGGNLLAAEKRGIVNEHIATVNLTQAAEKYPDEISGGMKQRVGIARALAIRPKGLLMDELFGALDALTRGKLQRQVLDIWENHRQAVMMITHDVDEALCMSDRIILMINAAQIGEILEVPFPHSCNSEELRQLPEYYELRSHALNFLDRHFGHDD